MEKVQVGARVCGRICIFVYYLIVFFSTSYFIHWTTKDPVHRKRRFSRNAAKWTDRLCRAFGIERRVINPPPEGAPGLVVGNHMGFVDILAMCSLTPTLFITSEDMRQTPLLGLITEMGGCAYVNRKSRVNILNELKEMVFYLQQGFRVVIYPEATSHNGEEVLPFKRTLLTSAAHAGVPIRPYVFNFLSIDGEPFSFKNRDAVCWYGDIGFVEAVLALFKLKHIVCEIKYLDLWYPTVDEDRAVLADGIRNQIAKEFIPVR